MAERRISQLTQTTNPNTDAVLPVVNSNITLKVTVNDLVKASSWGNHKINNLESAAAAVDSELDPSSYRIAVQPGSDSTQPPQKVILQTLYPRPSATDTINFSFNNTTRLLQANLKNRSLYPIHFTTACVEGSAIADGTITQQKIDPNAKLAGAVGGGNDRIFFENDQIVTTNYTITSGKNAMSAGPITISSGVTVTVPNSSTWTVV